MNATKEEVQFIGKCQFCKRRYVQEDCRAVERRHDKSTIITECPLCKGSLLVIIFRGVLGLVTTIGIPTDLSKEDYKKVAKNAPITLDDVLATHSHLKSFIYRK